MILGAPLYKWQDRKRQNAGEPSLLTGHRARAARTPSRSCAAASGYSPLCELLNMGHVSISCTETKQCPQPASRCFPQPWAWTMRHSCWPRGHLPDLYARETPAQLTTAPQAAKPKMGARRRVLAGARTSSTLSPCTGWAGSTQTGSNPVPWAHL